MRSAAPVPISILRAPGQQAVPAKMGLRRLRARQSPRAVHTLLIRRRCSYSAWQRPDAHALAENLIHDLGAPRQRRHDLMPVHKFRRRVWLCPASPAASVITRTARAHCDPASPAGDTARAVPDHVCRFHYALILSSSGQVQVGDRALERLSGQGDGLGQRGCGWMVRPMSLRRAHLDG